MREGFIRPDFAFVLVWEALDLAYDPPSEAHSAFGSIVERLEKLEAGLIDAEKALRDIVEIVKDHDGRDGQAELLASVYRVHEICDGVLDGELGEWEATLSDGLDDEGRI